MATFEDLDDNPFKDHSIDQAIRASQNAEVLNNYTPFDQPPTGQPAVLQPSQDPPTYKKTATVVTVPEIEEYKRKLEEVNKRQEELDRREREIESRQPNLRRNNWPPFVESIGITPCFYMNIEEEISVEFQRILKRMYQLWILHGTMLVLNVIGAFLLLIVFGEIVSFVASIIYLIIFTPLSFLCWYRPVYKAFKEDSSSHFMVFFFVFFFQFLITTFMAVGVLSSGACGIWKAILCLTDPSVSGKVVGVIILLISLGFSATAAIELFLLSRMLQIYRGSNASASKAMDEMKQNVMGSKIVQDAAQQVAQEVAVATIKEHIKGKTQPEKRS